jgi:hypothetical protein
MTSMEVATVLNVRINQSSHFKHTTTICSKIVSMWVHCQKRKTYTEHKSKNPVANRKGLCLE